MSFLKEKHKNNNQGDFLDFYEFILYMIFSMFLKMANPIMTIFMKNFKNHLGSEFVKIQDFTLNIIFRISQNDIYSEKWKFGNSTEFSLFTPGTKKIIQRWNLWL